MKCPVGINKSKQLQQQQPLLHSGGIERGNRCICVISVAAGQPPASTK